MAARRGPVKRKRAAGVGLMPVRVVLLPIRGGVEEALSSRWKRAVGELREVPRTLSPREIGHNGAIPVRTRRDLDTFARKWNINRGTLYRRVDFQFNYRSVDSKVFGISFVGI